jgi:hypothetical protein
VRERRFVRPLTFMIAVAIQLGLASAAMAHKPTITAQAVCEAGTPVINYTSTSWSPNPLEGENPSIQIYLNGVLAATGAYVYPGNSFSGTLSAPTGTSATLHAYAAAPWGNGNAGGQFSSITVPLPVDCPVVGTGRFTGGGSQVRVGAVRVTRGLTIHCDLLLSNNLEVNWGGDKFHMLEHMQTVECSDDPNIIQAPPDAPLDTLIGLGRGRYNNVEGYTIEFTLQDFGEPGTSDRMAIKIYQTSNPANVVLNVPLQVLSGGNLQAHYDQPHK